eukprot:COSAG01_NODE_16589_length_1223_cov_1.323843_2_plen_64_part_00
MSRDEGFEEVEMRLNVVMRSDGDGAASSGSVELGRLQDWLCAATQQAYDPSRSLERVQQLDPE